MGGYRYFVDECIYFWRNKCFTYILQDSSTDDIFESPPKLHKFWMNVHILGLDEETFFHPSFPIFIHLNGFIPPIF